MAVFGEKLTAENISEVIKKTTIGITQDTSKKATLMFSPEELSINRAISGVAKADIFLDAKTHLVTSFQIEASYDSQVFSDVTIQDSEFTAAGVIFFNTVDEELGRISYAGGIKPNSNPLTGQVRIATLQLSLRQGSTASNSSIILLDKSQVTDMNRNDSVLGNFPSLQVKIY